MAVAQHQNGSEPWARLPIGLFTCGLSHGAVVYYGWHSARYGGYEKDYPSVPTLAAQLGVSARAIKRWNVELWKAGWLTFRNRGRGVSTNLYELTATTQEAARLREERQGQEFYGARNVTIEQPASRPQEAYGDKTGTFDGDKNDPSYGDKNDPLIQLEVRQLETRQLKSASSGGGEPLGSPPGDISPNGTSAGTAKKSRSFTAPPPALDRLGLPEPEPCGDWRDELTW